MVCVSLTTPADRIATPLLLLQGLDDRVVPPDQTRAIEAQLRQRGRAVEAHYYPGEGHSFRTAQTRSDALEAELRFYRTLFG